MKIKKTFVIILLLFVSHITLGQKKKDTVYKNMKKEIISLTDFQLISEKLVYYKFTENESYIVKEAISRTSYLKLDSLENNFIQKKLSEIFAKDYNRKKKTFIHYYSKNDENVKEAKKNKKYWKYLKKRKENFQSFLTGTKNSKLINSKNIKVYIDKSNTLKKIFFKKSPSENNHIFIKPNGEVYIYYGNNNILHFLDYYFNK